MSEEIELQSLEDRGEQIARSAARLANFCKVKAPGMIIEMERQLLLKHILRFPVNTEDQLFHERVKLIEERDQVEHNKKTGYYDEAMKLIEQYYPGDTKC